MVGAVFVLVGILGFVPGVTDYSDGMKAAGHDSGAMLLHLFHVSILHNIIHLLFGVVGLLMSRTIAVLSRVVDLRSVDQAGQRREVHSGQHRGQLAALRTGRRHGSARRASQPGQFATAPSAVVSDPQR